MWYSFNLEENGLDFSFFSRQNEKRIKAQYGDAGCRLWRVFRPVRTTMADHEPESRLGLTLTFGEVLREGEPKIA